jgi:hypothetical protein
VPDTGLDFETPAGRDERLLVLAATRPDDPDARRRAATRRCELFRATREPRAETFLVRADGFRALTFRRLDLRVEPALRAALVFPLAMVELLLVV